MMETSKETGVLYAILAISYLAQGLFPSRRE